MAEFRLSNFTSGAVLTAAELNTGLTYGTYTPVWTQSSTITHTRNWARYTVFGKLVVASIKLTSTTAGTAGNAIKITLPVNASSDNQALGTAVFDGLTGAEGARFALYDTSTTMVFSGPFSAADPMGTTNFGVSNTIASGNIFYCTLQYEAA